MSHALDPESNDPQCRTHPSGDLVLHPSDKPIISVEISFSPSLISTNSLLLFRRVTLFIFFFGLLTITHLLSLVTRRRIVSTGGRVLSFFALATSRWPRPLSKHGWSADAVVFESKDTHTRLPGLLRGHCMSFFRSQRWKACLTHHMLPRISGCDCLPLGRLRAECTSTMPD